MPNYFKDKAAALAAHGYLPIPIKPGTKKCQEPKWPNFRFKPKDAEVFANYGIGILCGQGEYPLMAIDCDTTDPVLLDRLRYALGDTITRVGRAPRILYLFAAEKAGIEKMSSAKFVDEKGEKHQVEILGAGQQFVAYGIHPETGKPYKWTDAYGGPITIPAAGLPPCSVERAKEIIRATEEYCRAKGWKVEEPGKEAGAAAPMSEFDMVVAEGQKPNVDLEEAKKYLDMLPGGDVDDRARWVETGMALHFHFDGSVEAYQLWDAWSAKSAKYKGPEETEYLWGGFGKKRQRPVTMATIIARANKANEKALREAKRAELEIELSKVQACTDRYEVQNVLKKTSLTDSMDKEEFVKAAQAKVLELTGLKPSLASIRGYLPKPRKRGKYELTEDGNAQRFVDRYADSLRYVVETGEWLMWTGYYWAQTSDVEATELARQTVLAIVDDARECENEEERAALFTFCGASQKAAMYRHMIEIARGDDRIRIHASELDVQTRYVAVQNGEIDLKTLQFISAEQTHYLTQVMGVAYDPQADCPLWKKTVLEVCSGDEKKAEFYQLIASYPILGEPIEQKFFTLQGGGANGKSTLTNTILHVYGQFGLITPSETLLGQSTNSNAGQTREDLLRLKGKRLVTVMEPDDDKPLKEGTIKALTGGEQIAARGLYAKKTVSFKPQFTLHFCTNHDLLIRGTDHGILRRTVIMTFDRVFKESEQDKTLCEKLKAEGSGILNWILEGVKKYRQTGLAIPSCVAEATERYKEGQDLTKEWLEECFEFGPGYAVSSIAAFQSWEAYAEPRGLRGYIKNTRSLSKKLSGKGFKCFQHQHGIKGRGFEGLRLRDFSNLGESE